MKKNNYNDIEEYLSDKAPRLERDINYSGAVRASETVGGKKTGKESGGFFQTPAMQIIGVFLVAVMVGGGTFGALKYLEYRGAKISGAQGGVTEQTSASFGSDETDGVLYVKGDQSADNHYIAVTSAGETYYPAVMLESRERHQPSGLSDITNYDYTESNVITVPYGDGFVIKNNVTDREMNVVSVSINDPNDERAATVPINTDLNGLYEYLSNARGGTVTVEIKATWDEGDDIYKYGTCFKVVKEASKPAEKDKFGDVTVINFYNPQNLSRDSIVNLKPYPESVKIALPIENDHTTVYHIVSDEADALGFEIYLYNSQSNKALFEGLCVLDRDGKLVMNFEPGFLRFAPMYLIYAGDTPSNHPMFFFTSIQTLSGPDWYYTSVFSFDITTKKVTMLGITGPKAYGSDSFYTSGILQYNEESKEIQYVVDEIQRSGTPDKATTGRTFIFTDRIIWDGEKYVLENLPYPEQGGKITDGDDYDPTGWLAVQVGTDYCYPTIIHKKVIDGGNIADTEYSDGICEIKYNSSNEINIGNTVRRAWRIYSVTVDYKNEFTTFEDAIKYAREITENTNHTAHVEAVITWNSEAIYKDDVKRTEYTFAFNLSFEETEDKTPAPGDWVTINIGTDAFYPAATQKRGLRNDGLNEITEYPAEIPMFDWEIKDDISFTVQRDGPWQMLNIKVNDEVYFTSFASAMKHISGLYGTTHVEFALLFDDIEGALYTYAFDLFVTDKSETTTTPAPDIEVNTENPAEVFDTWLRSKLFAGMRFEDLRKTVWKIDVGGYTIGTEYAAGNYKQVNYENDGSFVRYGNDVYDWTFYAENDGLGEPEGGTIRETRLILRKGHKNFDLPCGITLDMTPHEALVQMGFSEEQITALEGKTTRNGGLEISYINNNLNITYLINENGYVTDIGVEITSGSQNEVYIEIERQ